MVNFLKKTEANDIDVVCPMCFRTLISFTILNEFTDEYGREFRTYLCWHEACPASGFEVVQFKRAGHWVIHQYRSLPVQGAVIDTHKPSKMILVNDIPNPNVTPVVTGPGGDFTEGFTPEISDAIKNLCAVLRNTAASFESLLKK